MSIYEPNSPVQLASKPKLGDIIAILQFQNVIIRKQNRQIYLSFFIFLFALCLFFIFTYYLKYIQKTQLVELATKSTERYRNSRFLNYSIIFVLILFSLTVVGLFLRLNKSETELHNHSTAELINSSPTNIELDIPPPLNFNEIIIKLFSYTLTKCIIVLLGLITVNELLRQKFNSNIFKIVLGYYYNLGLTGTASYIVTVGGITTAITAILFNIGVSAINSTVISTMLLTPLFLVIIIALLFNLCRGCWAYYVQLWAKRAQQVFNRTTEEGTRVATAALFQAVNEEATRRVGGGLVSGVSRVTIGMGEIAGAGLGAVVSSGPGLIVGAAQASGVFFGGAVRLGGQALSKFTNIFSRNTNPPAPPLNPPAPPLNPAPPPLNPAPPPLNPPPPPEGGLNLGVPSTDLNLNADGNPPPLPPPRETPPSASSDYFFDPFDEVVILDKPNR